jgi:hypothetical protein
MKYLILFLVTIFLNFFNADSQTRVDYKFKFDGVDREFIVSKPSGPVPSGGYPMVMMLHGTTGDGFFKDMAHIYPNGINYPVSATILCWEFCKQTFQTTPGANIQIPTARLVVAPNPASTHFQIQVNPQAVNPETRMALYNSIGQLVWDLPAISDLGSRVDCSVWQPGIYIMKLYDRASSIQTKALITGGSR